MAQVDWFSTQPELRGKLNEFVSRTEKLQKELNSATIILNKIEKDVENNKNKQQIANRIQKGAWFAQPMGVRLDWEISRWSEALSELNGSMGEEEGWLLDAKKLYKQIRNSDKPDSEIRTYLGDLLVSFSRSGGKEKGMLLTIINDNYPAKTKVLVQKIQELRKSINGANSTLDSLKFTAQSFLNQGRSGMRMWVELPRKNRK